MILDHKKEVDRLNSIDTYQAYKCYDILNNVVETNFLKFDKIVREEVQLDEKRKEKGADNE